MQDKSLYLFNQFFDAFAEQNEEQLKIALVNFRKFVFEELKWIADFSISDEGKPVCKKDGMIDQDLSGFIQYFFLYNDGVRSIINKEKIDSVINILNGIEDDLSHIFANKELELEKRKYLTEGGVADDQKQEQWDVLRKKFEDQSLAARGTTAYKQRRAEFCAIELYLKQDYVILYDEAFVVEQPVDELAQYAIERTFVYKGVARFAEEQILPVLYSAIASKRMKSQKMDQIIKQNPSYSIARRNGLTFQDPLSSAEKIKLVYALNYVAKNKSPFSFVLCNNLHFCTMVLYPINLPDGKQGVSMLFFDGMSEMKSSYANKWVTEADGFLQEVSAKKDLGYKAVQDCHVHVQSQSNCWLSVAMFIGIVISHCALSHDLSLLKSQIEEVKNNKSIEDGASSTLQELHTIIKKQGFAQEVEEQLLREHIEDGLSLVDSLTNSINTISDLYNNVKELVSDALDKSGIDKPDGAGEFLKCVHNTMVEDGCVPALEYKMSWLRGIIDIPIFCFHIYWNIDFIGHRITMINTMYLYMTESSLKNSGEDSKTPLAPEGYQYVWMCVLSIFSEEPLIEAAKMYMQFLEEQRRELNKLSKTPESLMKKKCVLKGDFDRILDKVFLDQQVSQTVLMA